MESADKTKMLNSGMEIAPDGSLNYSEDTVGDNAKKLVKNDASSVFNHKDFSSLPDPAKNKVFKEAFKGMTPDEIGKLKFKESGNLDKDGLPDTEADNKGAAMKKRFSRIFKRVS